MSRHYTVSQICTGGVESYKSKTLPRSPKAFCRNTSCERSITQRYLTLCGGRLGEESIPRQPLHWSNHLIETVRKYLNPLFIIISYRNCLPIIYLHSPLTFSTLFILSGFVARHIVQWPGTSVLSFFQKLVQYQEQMPANMSTAFAQFIQGDAKQWVQNCTVLKNDERRQPEPYKRTNTQFRTRHTHRFSSTQKMD